MKTKKVTRKLMMVFSLAFLFAIALSSCSQPDPEPEISGIEEPTPEPEPEPQPEPEPEPEPEPTVNPDAAAINSLISALSYSPEDFLNVQDTGGGPSSKNITNESTMESQPERGTIETCSRKDFNLKSNFDDVAILRPTNGIIYPGALIVGNRGMLDGAPDPLNLGRAPVILRLDLPGIGEQGNIKVEDPSKNSNVQTAIDGALEWWNANAYQEGYVNASNSSYQATTSYSSKQTSLDVGLNLEWASGSVASQFESESNIETRVATMAFKQVFYTITMDTPETNNPASVFAIDTDLNQVSSAMSSENPPAYVNSVSYGRIIMFRMETENSDSSISLDAVLEYASGVSGTGTVNATYDAVIKNSTINIITIGGNAEVASSVFEKADIKEGPGTLNPILTGENAVYSRNNPGVPIGYTIRYLKDNSLAKMGYTTDYSVQECTSSGVEHQNSRVKKNISQTLRFRFTYNERNSENSNATDWTEVKTNNVNIAAKPPSGAHNIRIQFEFLDVFVWTTMGEYKLSDSPQEYFFEGYCSKRVLGLCTEIAVRQL